MRKTIICSVAVLVLVLLGFVLYVKCFAPLRGLKDEDPAARRHAVEGLAASWVPDPLKHLTIALKDTDADVRATSAVSIRNVLATVDDPEKLARVAEPLVNALEDDDIRVRTAVAMSMWIALPAVEDLNVRARATELLIRVMKHGDGQAGWRPGENRGNLGRSLREMGWYIGEALREVGAPAVEPLILAIRDADSEPNDVELRRAFARLRACIGQALSKIGEPALAPLTGALQDEDLGTRRAAALGLYHVLGAIPQEARVRSLDELLRTMKDEDPKLCGRIAFSLGEIGEPALEPLTSALQDEDVHVRRAAGQAVQQVARSIQYPAFRTRAVAPLVHALRDEDRHVQASAAAALVRIGEAALESLLRISQSTDEPADTRAFAVYALGQILGIASDPSILQAIVSVVTTLGHTLENDGVSVDITWQPWLVSRVVSNEVRTPALEDESITRQTIDVCLKALKHDSLQVRSLAARALIQTGTAEARDAVRNAGFDPGTLPSIPPYPDEPEP